MKIIQISAITTIFINCLMMGFQKETSSYYPSAAPNGSRPSKIIKNKSDFSPKQQAKMLGKPIKALYIDLALHTKEKAELRAAIESLRYQTLVGVKGPRLSKKSSQVYNKVRQLINDPNVSNETFQAVLNYMLKTIQ